MKIGFGKIIWPVILPLVILLLIAGWVWYVQCGGVSHREIKETVVEESAKVQSRVDARCDALEQKLDRIEAKLDRLIEMATPKLPDGMRFAE